MMEKLTPETINSILHSILDFVNDDMRASLLMTHSTLEESNFIIKVATTNHVHTFNYNLGKEMKDVLQKIIEKKSSQTLWKMKLDKKIILINKTRNITIVKTPYFEDETDQQVQSFQSVNDGCIKKKKTKKEKGMKSKLAKNEPLENELNGNKSTEMLDVASTSENMYKNSRHKIVMVSEQITRLVEGLSAPIDGGKGLRMMQMMGWDGGALGLRGEGITEPIMPNLNIVEGDKKTKAKTNKTTDNAENPISNVYTTVIKRLYNHLIKDRKTETVIRMASSAKEKLYIKSFINCLNKRSDMSLKKYMRDIFTIIKIEMMKAENKDLVIAVEFENNEIQLRTGNASHFPLPKRNQEKAAIGNSKSDSDTATSKENKTKQWLDFKINVLEKVAEFLDNDKSKEEVELKEVVSGKYSNFLDQVVGAVNKKHRVKVVDAIETDAWDLLFSKLKTKYLFDIVHQHSFQKFILRKQPILVINKKVISNVSEKINENGEDATNVKTSKTIKPEIVGVNLKKKTVKYTDLTKPDLNIAKEEINEKSKTAKTVINKELPKLDIAQGNIIGEAKSDVTVKYTDSPKLEIVEAKKTNEKTICVVYKTYPDDLIDIDTVVAFQYLINHVVSSSTDWLPLLECHGVQNGALIYTCYNDKTLYWFSHLIKDACNKVKIVSPNNILEEILISKVTLKINSFINENDFLILERLQMYNKKLDVSNWVVISKEFYDSYLVLTIELDKMSLDYISRNNFSLFCGHDKAKFSIIWN